MNYELWTTRYETHLTQPKRAAQPSNEIQSTKDYVRNYKRFMQNKPNFRKSQMNVNIYNTRDCENKSDWTLGKNKPNSNPIKPNCRKGKIDAKSVLTKDQLLMIAESQFLSSLSPRACPRCMLTCFSAGDLSSLAFFSLPPRTTPLTYCRGSGAVLYQNLSLSSITHRRINSTPLIPSGWPRY